MLLLKLECRQQSLIEPTDARNLLPGTSMLHARTNGVSFFHRRSLFATNASPVQVPALRWQSCACSHERAGHAVPHINDQHIRAQYHARSLYTSHAQHVVRPMPIWLCTINTDSLMHQMNSTAVTAGVAGTALQVATLQHTCAGILWAGAQCPVDWSVFCTGRQRVLRADSSVRSPH